MWIIYKTNLTLVFNQSMHGRIPNSKLEIITKEKLVFNIESSEETNKIT